ncbi:hypothetical protein PTKIN_Ptkin09bG0270200 [Pterospermum kingtungense]
MEKTHQKLKKTENNEESKLEVVVGSDFTCEICTEIVSASNKFSNNASTGKCKHEFCCDCVAKYIESMVGINVAYITCPALECKFSLDPVSCKSIITKHLFDKWCDLLCHATVSNYYSKRFIYCPYRDCSALILNECKDKVQKCNCPNCKNEICFQCKSPWHARYRCRDKAKYKDSDDFLARKLIEKKKWTRCPHCGNAVEQIGGCPSINCRCGEIFCHACGKPSRAGHRCRQSCCTSESLEDVCMYTMVLIVMIAVLLFIVELIVLSCKSLNEP